MLNAKPKYEYDLGELNVFEFKLFLIPVEVYSWQRSHFGWEREYMVRTKMLHTQYKSLKAIKKLFGVECSWFKHLTVINRFTDLHISPTFLKLDERKK